MNRVISSYGVDSSVKISDEKELIDTLICTSNSDRFHSYNCVFGKCSRCRDTTATIQNHYQETLEINPPPIVTWNSWERATVNNGTIKRIMVTKQKTVTDLIAELYVDVSNPCQGTSFTEHMFNAS